MAPAGAAAASLTNAIQLIIAVAVGALDHQLYRLRLQLAPRFRSLQHRSPSDGAQAAAASDCRRLRLCLC